MVFLSLLAQHYAKNTRLKFTRKNSRTTGYAKKNVKQPSFTNLGTRLDLLNADHKAVKYVQSRQIPKEKYSNFYYSPDFSKIMADFDRTGHRKPDSSYRSTTRWASLLEYKDEQSMTQKAIRYITLKKEGQERLWYNLDKIDPRSTVYVTEGPIDSMFIPNCTAMQGAGWLEELPAKIAKFKSSVYI
jgi:hypothetical protein